MMVAGGAVALTVGADWLVKGSAGLALALGVAPLVVGLTIVSYGTSAPELVVGIGAALTNRPDIAVGNSVGSNLCDLALILGLTVLVAPPRVEGGLMKRDLPMLLLSVAVVPLLALDGTLGRIDGAVLLLVGAGYVIWTLRSAAGSPPAEVPVRRARMAALAAAGLLLLLAGGKLFVDGSVSVARALGVSERIIGLTLVSIGTSLPELATSVFASARGQSSIAVGTVVGSNIFNIFFILGAAALARPLPIDLRATAWDWSVLGVATILVAVMLRGERRVSRLEGALLVALYAAFVISLAG